MIAPTPPLERRRDLYHIMDAEWPTYTGLAQDFDAGIAERFGLKHATVRNARQACGFINRPRPASPPLPIPEVPRTPGASGRVLRECGAQTGVGPRDLLSHKRARHIAHPRQACMAALRLTGRYSYPQIGRLLGGRDHTTIMHGVAQALDRAAQCPEARELLASLLGAAQMAMAA